MGNQVTYLFGAGASANTLPVVLEIPVYIQKAIDKISAQEFNLSGHKANFLMDGTALENGRQKLIEDLQWLKEKSADHASVDTFAKKLFLTEDYGEYNRLKVVLSVFLVFVQLDKAYDKRYDTFYASILKDKVGGFPTNVKILSWNYDYQFERAYNEYSKSRFLIDEWNNLNVRQNLNNYSGTPRADFEIFKLNGTAQTMRKKDNQLIAYNYELHEPLTKNSFAELVNQYINARFNSHEYVSTLRFAWEELTGIFPDAKAAVSLTDVLVIIGYSFPFFNRQIDMFLLNSMLKLKKVYFQDPTPEKIVSRFKAIRRDLTNIEIILYKEKDQFLLPDEL